MSILLKARSLEARIIHSASSKWTLKELQDLVGGYIEQVMVTETIALIVNEEGRLKNLPYNHLATVFSGQEIVGDAVIVAVRGEDYVG